MPAARRAGPGDIALVQAITAEAYEEYIVPFGGPPLPVTEDYAPHIAAGGVWIVSAASVDAAVAVFEAAPDHLMIFSLAVRPAARGQGLGRWLLDFAAAQARTAGLPELRLYTNARMMRNIRIYEQAGFEETGRRPNPARPGWTFVDMARRLA